MLYDKLYPYQKQITDNYESGGIPLFMDMGTGKTYTSLACFEKTDADKLLVVCLATKVQDWYNDVQEVEHVLPTMLNKGTKKNVRLIEEDKANCYIVSFESSFRLEHALMNWVDEDTFIIIDESHKIKTPNSKVTKYMLKLGEKTQYKAILTGTPQSQGYIDYYTQFKFLGLWNMKLRDFKNKYCIEQTRKINGYYINQITGYKNYQELDKIICDNAIYYDRKLDDEFIPSDIVVEVKKPQLYDTVLKNEVYHDKNNELHIYDTLGAKQYMSRSIVGGYLENDVVSTTKLDELKGILESANNERVCIFYNFNKEHELICELISSLKRPYSSYNGADKDLNNFILHDNGIVVCNYMSASTGLNDLVVSNIMVFYSMTPNYIDYAQARKRIDRIGQTKKPLYYNLVMSNTIESRIFKQLQLGKDFDETMMKNYFGKDE